MAGQGRTRAEQSILRLLRERTRGYDAVTDSPACGLVPELMQLYPDAVVVCTVRDAASWEPSMAGAASASTKWFLRVVLLPVSAMRYFVNYINGLRDAWLCAYGETEPPTRQSWDRHMQWLRETVPAERLVFFDVRQGRVGAAVQGARLAGARGGAVSANQRRQGH